MRKKHLSPLTGMRISLALLMLMIMTTGLSQAADMDIPFTLNKPAGDGPFPAVVILHDCSGLGPYSSAAPWRWSTRLVALGYVTIWPDSFSTRGFPNGICITNSQGKVNYEKRADDAHTALAYLRSLPYVDGNRIAVMGGSHGGSSTLAAIVEDTDNPKNGFAAAIALYPNCAARFGEWYPIRETPTKGRVTGYHGTFRPHAPFLILIGELDDWTPARPCRELVTRAEKAGYPAEIVVYPDAHHSFDSRAPVKYSPTRRNVNIEGGWGATTGGNKEAWTDAIAQVERFLTRHLSK